MAQQERLAQQELQVRAQREQIAALQDVLNSLSGLNLEAAEAHRNIAIFVTRLAARANATLTISGEFADRKEDTVHIHTLIPITIRCDEPQTVSFLIRTAEAKPQYVMSAKRFPQLYAIPKQDQPTEKKGSDFP